MTALATNETMDAVTVPRAELARALRAASSIKSKNVRIDMDDRGAEITGSTGAVAVRTVLSSPGGLTKRSAIVPRALLASLLPYLAGEVTLTIPDEIKVELHSGDGTYEIRQLREDTFPLCGFDDPAPVIRARYEAPTLVEVLKRVLPFASRDETRPVLATVALYPEHNCASATDSYRLAVIGYGDQSTEPNEGTEPILVAVDVAQSMRMLLAKQLGEVVISETDSHTCVAFDDLTWSMRRPRGRSTGNGYDRNGYDNSAPALYPKWWTLFPDHPNAVKADHWDATVKVDRNELREAARAARVVAGRMAPLRFNENAVSGVRITASGPDIGSMTRKLTTAVAEGEPMEIGFNPDFVAHICDVAPVETLTFRLISPLRPAKVEAGRDQYLLMPIRLNV